MTDTALTIKLNDKELHIALAKAPEQLKSAMRNGLNDTARDFQGMQRTHIGVTYKFKSANSKRWLQRTVYFPARNRATKSKLSALVQIRTGQDLLAMHERGGAKTAFHSDLVFMPVRSIRAGGGQVNRKDAWKSFQPFTTSYASSALSFRKGAVAGRKARGSQTRAQTTGQKGSFFIRSRSGHPMLVQRKKGALRILYIGLPRVQIKPTLDFAENANTAAQRHWPRRMTGAAQQALRKVRLAP